MSLPENLPHSCTIQKSAYVPDDIAADYDDPDTLREDGTYAHTSESDAQEIACWVQPASKNEINRFQRREQNVTHTVYFRGDPGVKPGYVILPNNNGLIDCPFAGKTLEVKAEQETTAGLGLLWGVVCEELQAR